MLTQRGPTALAIEDLHWADHKTLDWIKFIGRRIALLLAVLIISFRDDEVIAEHPVKIALSYIPFQSKIPPSLTAAELTPSYGHRVRAEITLNSVMTWPTFETEWRSATARGTISLYPVYTIGSAV